MNLKQLQKLAIEHNTTQFAWNGHCHDCGKETTVNVDISPDGKVTAEGGAIYNIKINGNDAVLVKCDECFDKSPVATNWQPTEVYSRVVGYYRPISNFNSGKKAEYKLRKNFKEPAPGAVC